MQGRLQGKRFHGRFFLDEVLSHGAEACNYLLAVDVDMNTVEGFAISSWEQGYGDFAIRPDLATLRRGPWQPGTAMMLGLDRKSTRLNSSHANISHGVFWLKKNHDDDACHTRFA